MRSKTAIATDPVADLLAIALERLTPEQIQALATQISDRVEVEKVLGSSLMASPPICSPTKKEADGWIVAKWVTRGKKSHGPYYYLRWREGKRQRSKYLGKTL